MISSKVRIPLPPWPRNLPIAPAFVNDRYWYVFCKGWVHGLALPSALDSEIPFSAQLYITVELLILYFRRSQGWDARQFHRKGLEHTVGHWFKNEPQLVVRQGAMQVAKRFYRVRKPMLTLEKLFTSLQSKQGCAPCLLNYLRLR